MSINDEIAKILDKIPSDFGGGCPLEKAIFMGNSIVNEDIRLSIDIGVYKGRSLVPQALAHKTTNGKVIGIDPYIKAFARESDVSIELEQKINSFIDSWDTLDTYYQLLNFIIDENLGNHAFLVREKSEVLASKIEDRSAGMIHIDGNHDTKYVEKDIVLYLPKLRKNGMLIMDDTDWPSVSQCLNLVRYSCELEHDFGCWQVWRKTV